MGKGKNGCSTSVKAMVDPVSKDNIRLMVEAGESDAVLEAALSDQRSYITVAQWLGELCDTAKSEDDASRFLHLQAAVYYTMGQENPRMLDKAYEALQRDFDHPDTSESFRRMAERKMETIRAERYQLRFSPDQGKNDQSVMMRARTDHQPVLLRAQDPGLELAMLRDTFGDDNVIVARETAGPIGYVDDRSLIGFYSSVGIGRAFVTGSLVEAMDDGKVFVLPPHFRPEPDLAFKVESAATVHRLLDEEGREHKAAPGFMAVVMFDDQTDLSSFDSLLEFEQDFSSWKP